MPYLAVSFHLDYDSTYTDRYASLMKAIRSCPKVWEETTSFAIVETTEKIEDFERRLFLTDFKPSVDTLLVIDVSYDTAISRGKIRDPKTLKELLPGLQAK